jgi:hypothetical protein
MLLLLGPGPSKPDISIQVVPVSIESMEYGIQTLVPWPIPREADSFAKRPSDRGQELAVRIAADRAGAVVGLVVDRDDLGNGHDQYRHRCRRSRMACHLAVVQANVGP